MTRTDAWGNPIQFRTRTSVPFGSLADAKLARDAYSTRYGGRWEAKVVKRDDRWYVATPHFTDSTHDWLAGFRAGLEAAPIRFAFAKVTP